MEKKEFVQKVSDELDGSFFAELDGEVLWAIYVKMQHDNNAEHKTDYSKELSYAIEQALYHAKQRKEIRQ